MRDQPIALSDAEVVRKLKRKPSEGEQIIASLSEGAAKKCRKTVETVSVCVTTAVERGGGTERETGRSAGTL